MSTLERSWTIEQEQMLRDVHISDDLRLMLMRLLELGPEASESEFQTKGLIKEAPIKGLDKEDEELGALPVGILEYLVNKNPLDHRGADHLSLTADWRLVRSNNYDQVPPGEEPIKYFEKHSHMELVYGCHEDFEVFQAVIDRIAPLQHDHSQHSRFTILIPNQKTDGDVDATRNGLRWDSYLLTVDKDPRIEYLLRIITTLQLLNLYNPYPTKATTLRELMVLLSEKSNRDTKIDGASNRFCIRLPKELVDSVLRQLGYEKLKDQAYVNFKYEDSHLTDNRLIKANQYPAPIRSNKGSQRDPNATDNDLKRIRTALANLITHTGGIAITLDVENVAGDGHKSLATPSIALPDEWIQALRALRLRNAAPESGQKRAIHVGVNSSLDQNRRYEEEAVVHSIPDPNPL